MNIHQKIKLLIKTYYNDVNLLFAEDLGFSDVSVGQYIRTSTPRLFACLKIANTFDISIDDLINDDAKLVLKWNERIKDKREKLNIDVASRLNIDKKYYKQIESAEVVPHKFLLFRIARTLNINVEFLKT